MNLSDDTDVSCHLQVVGLGGLICRAASREGRHPSNEVSPEACHKCEIGRIFREIGCDSVSGKLLVYGVLGRRENLTQVENVFCNKRTRETNINFCKSCDLVQSETTRENVRTTQGLLESLNFFQSKKDLEKARIAMREGNCDSAITYSSNCVESTLKRIFEQIGVPLPSEKSITGLWKGLKDKLRDDQTCSNDSSVVVVNNVAGLITKLGQMRNELSDAHGRGDITPSVYQSYAELSTNLASALSTFLVRRYLEIKGAKNGGHAKDSSVTT